MWVYIYKVFHISLYAEFFNNYENDKMEFRPSEKKTHVHVFLYFLELFLMSI